MFRWAIQHQTEISTLTNLAIAFLTLVLIIITTIYVRANWNIMRMMETDLRIKTQPIPHLEHTILRIDGGYQLSFTLTTSNAPLILQKTVVTAIFGNVFSGQTSKIERHEGPTMLNIAQPFIFTVHSIRQEPIVEHTVEIDYFDQSGTFNFHTTFRNYRGEKLYNKDHKKYGEFLPVHNAVFTTITRQHMPFELMTPKKPPGPIGRVIEKINDFFYVPTEFPDDFQEDVPKDTVKNSE